MYISAILYINHGIEYKSFITRIFSCHTLCIDKSLITERIVDGGIFLP